MKNKLIYILTSKVNVNVKGRNIEKFIKRLYVNEIDVLNIFYLNENEINIKIYKKDYDKLLSIKTIYEISVIDYKGAYRIKEDFKYNKYILLFIILGIVFIYMLSNITFNIKIFSNDTEILNILNKELNNYNIKKYTFKKNYNELQEIKQKIIENNKERIEWLEIEYSGTSAIIKVEPRIIKNYKEKNFKRNIIAKKDAIIYSMDVKIGEILKGINSFVKKGDMIVSGIIKLNDTLKKEVSSTGKIYGEVWYTVNISYPLKYNYEYETKRNKKILTITFLNKKIELFNFKKYKYKNIRTKKLIKNNLLPISFNLELQKEKNLIRNTYTEKEAINNALKYSIDEMQKKLKEKEFIKDYKIIKKTNYSDKVDLKIFYSVIEEIGEYQQIVNNDYNEQE